MTRLLDPTQTFAELSAGFAWDIPDRFNLAQACLYRHADTRPAATGLIDCTGDRRIWDYGELARHSRRVAGLLADMGVGQGDRVAILLPQGPATLIAHFATYHLGAVALPLFTLFGSSALDYRLRDSGAKVVVTERGQLSKLPAGPDVLSIDGGAPDFWATGSVPPPMVDTAAEDPAVMIYTSGTTGDPKGVLHAHRFLFGHLPCMELGHGGFPNGAEVGWTPADWAWIGGLMDMAMPCFYYGVPLVAKRFTKFDADDAFALMVRESVTRAFLPPTALKLMRKTDPPAGLALQSVTSGGEPLGDDLVAWLGDAVGAEVNELYGQTECNLCIGSARAQSVARQGTLGQPFPGFDVTILDGDGLPVPPGELGQIAVRRGTPSMMLGYWNKPDKTQQKFLGDWMLTGDLGTMDADGFVTFVARDDDVITSAGYRIGPSEVEAALARDPDVVMAAAVAKPDPIKGHVVAAFVTVAGQVPEGFEARLIDRVRRDASPHMAPKSVTVIDAMPMTATGKIQRKVLRDRFI